MPGYRKNGKRKAPKGSMKRKAAPRRKAARAKKSYRPKPEVKIFQDPQLDTDTNQVAPSIINFTGGLAPSGSVSVVKTLIQVPAPWALAVQGTGQEELLGRRCYVQSLKQMFRLSFDNLKGLSLNPRLRIIHGWCLGQVIAQGTPMSQPPNAPPVQVWGDPQWHNACVSTNVAQQLQYKLTTPNTKILKILSDSFYVAKATAGAGAANATGIDLQYTRTAIEFTKWWPMKRQLNWKEAPGGLGTSSGIFVPQQQEPIPFCAIIWDNADEFSAGGLDIKVETRSQMRVQDN